MTVRAETFARYPLGVAALRRQASSTVKIFAVYGAPLWSGELRRSGGVGTPIAGRSVREMNPVKGSGRRRTAFMATVEGSDGNIVPVTPWTPTVFTKYARSNIPKGAMAVRRQTSSEMGTSNRTDGSDRARSLRFEALTRSTACRKYTRRREGWGEGLLSVFHLLARNRCVLKAYTDVKKLDDDKKMYICSSSSSI